MALTYFFVNTVPIAIAIALSTQPERLANLEDRLRVERAELPARRASPRPSSSRSRRAAGYWLTLLLTAAPLYLTYKMYRTGAESEARQGAILEAAHDAIITMDQQLNIREFNPAAEQMFGYARIDILGRHVETAAAAGRARRAARRAFERVHDDRRRPAGRPRSSR